ncbi:hypothetical protein YC2023_063882 [Brassica napus]
MTIRFTPHRESQLTIDRLFVKNKSIIGAEHGTQTTKPKTTKAQTAILLSDVEEMLQPHQEALKREIERLREVYQQQSLKKMENGNHSQATGTGANSAVDIKPSNEKEELFNNLDGRIGIVEHVHLCKEKINA